VILAGEVKSNTYLDVQNMRDVIRKIGYTKANTCLKPILAVFFQLFTNNLLILIKVLMSKQREQGAGDQGMMFGYATNETENYMPLALICLINITRISVLRRENNEITYLRPDAKSQVTLEYSDDNKPTRIDAIVISTQHDDFDEEATMLAKIKRYYRNFDPKNYC
jgi:S-adenosylmethionine synthetase